MERGGAMERTNEDEREKERDKEARKQVKADPSLR
jgi:hypothetical protein